MLLKNALIASMFLSLSTFSLVAKADTLMYSCTGTTSSGEAVTASVSVTDLNGLWLDYNGYGQKALQMGARRFVNPFTLAELSISSSLYAFGTRDAVLRTADTGLSTSLICTSPSK